MEARTIDEKPERTARQDEERRKQARAEILDLSDTLARLEGRRAQAKGRLDFGAGVEEERRRVVLAAVSGDEGALRELDRLDAEAAALRREVARLDLASSVARERLGALRGVLRETAAGRPPTRGGR